MLDATMDFLREADRLKSVERANVLMDLSRPENSAEHSWHVALYGLVFGSSEGGGDRALAMILLHDLVEIDTGDHPIHLTHDAGAVAEAEARAAERLFGLFPGGAALRALWSEFETAESPDARFAKRMDHVQPLFQVLHARRPLSDHVEIVRDNLDRGRAARLGSEWPEAVDAARSLLAGHGVGEGDLARRLAFLAEADRLKTVRRANRLVDGSRRENTAEHSWHLALYALALAPLAKGVDIGRVIRMALIHDLVEIDVGDVPLHSAQGQAHGAPERRAAEERAARRLFGLLPVDQGRELMALWQEFEAARTPEAVFAKGLDRFQPAFQNLASGGVGWREYSVTLTQLRARVGPAVRLASAPLWDWLDQRLVRHFT